MKQTWRRQARNRFITAACLLSLVAIASQSNAQRSLPPDKRQFLLNTTIGPNGRVLPRRARTPLVPLRMKYRVTSPSVSAAWRSYLKNYPETKPDLEALRKALQQRDNMPSAALSGRTAGPLVPGRPAPRLGGNRGDGGLALGGGFTRNAGRQNIATATNRTWISEGPFDVTPPADANQQIFFGNKKIAGRVNGIAHDNAGNVYAATAGGGLWKFKPNPNFDPETPWDPLNPRLLIDPYNSSDPSPKPLSDFTFPTLQTSSVAVDPRNNRVIYVGMGDYSLAGRDVVIGNGLFPARLSNNINYSVGMMKTVNGGTTWFNIANGRLKEPRRTSTTTLNPGTTLDSIDPALSNFDDEYNFGRIKITSGALNGQVRTITDYVGNAGTVTVGGVQFIIHRFTVDAAYPTIPAPPAGTTGYTMDLQPPIMEGTAVSSIVVDPDDSRRLLATTGRGVGPGRIWVSTDAGNNWELARFSTGQPLPIGDYSNVDYSLPFTDGTTNLRTRVYYAASVGQGIYRSFDRGVTWEQMNVPLVFNDPNRGGVPAGGPELGLKVVAGRKQGNAGLVYVFDASGGFFDGRVLKSLDGNNRTGAGWTDITGNYPRPEDANNFDFANYDTTLGIGQAIVNVLQLDGVGNVVPTGKTVTQEVLLGGQLFMGAALGAVSINNGIYGSTISGVPNLRLDTGVGQDWAEIAQGVTHGFHHAVTFDNISPFLGFSANDGGLYQISYQPGAIVVPAADDPDQTPLFFNGATFEYDILDNGQEPNQDFRISEIYRADFLETDPGTTPSRNVVRMVGSLVSNGMVQGTADYTGTTPNRFWSSLSFVFDNQFLSDTFFTNPTDPTRLDPMPIRFDANGEALNDPNGVRFAPILDPPLIFGFEIDNIVFDPTDPTGNTQYMITAGEPSTPWGDPDNTGNSWKSIFMTRDNWTSYQDITPNRYLSVFFGVVDAPDRDGPLFIYNSLEPADTATPGNWTGEGRPYVGMPIAFGFTPQISGAGLGNQFIPNTATPLPTANGPGGLTNQYTETTLYTGGQFLWRFDPPGSLAKPKYPPGPLGRTANPTDGSPPYNYFERVFPNLDYGAWRRVSPQLATGTDYITAIAIEPIRGSDAEAVLTNNRIYVGTSNGSVWITRDGTDLTPASVQADYIATTAAEWRQIAGPGVNGNTLPARPVTSISINTDPSATNLGDIIVTLGGAPNVARVWRSTNTTGAVTPIFTAVSGQGFASLPDVPVNGLARDPDDPTNTLYAATDLGVFTSIDGGATWSNATAPLGLPNVECTSIKVIPGRRDTIGTRSPRQLYVSTFGRGIYRFDLNDLVTSNSRPNLRITQNFTRNGNEIIVNVIVTNVATPGQAVGTAFDVRLTGATLQADNNPTQVSSTSFFDGPIGIGTIAPGQSQVVTIRFPASVGRPGRAVIFRANGSLTLPPFPPGTPSTFSNGTGYRTRLP
ncbi:MAG: hypothetical protein SFU56_21975 [Capsulimonadales bacterium]|nr:hypothetical protein [Capsulimonadales bacterium]